MKKEQSKLDLESRIGQQIYLEAHEENAWHDKERLRKEAEQKKAEEELLTRLNAERAVEEAKQQERGKNIYEAIAKVGEKWADELKVIRGKIEEKQEPIAKGRSRVERFRSEAENLENDIKKLEGHKAELASVAEKLLVNEKTKLDDYKTAVKRAKKELHEIIGELQPEIDHLEEQKEELNDRLTKLKDEAEKIKSGKSTEASSEIISKLVRKGKIVKMRGELAEELTEMDGEMNDEARQFMEERIELDVERLIGPENTDPKEVERMKPMFMEQLVDSRLMARLKEDKNAALYEKLKDHAAWKALSVGPGNKIPARVIVNNLKSRLDSAAKHLLGLDRKPKDRS